MSKLLKTTLFATAAILTSSIAQPAEAFFTRRNERLSNITRQDLASYCANQLQMTYGKVVVNNWGERHFSCEAEVRKTFSAKSQLDSEFSGNAGIGATWKKIFKIDKNVSTSVRTTASGRATVIIRYARRGVSLRDYCRSLTTTGRIFIPWVEHGRIFEAEGGKACHITRVF